MPLTPAQMEAAILMLQNETRRLNTVTQQQAAKIAALEKAPGELPWDRLIAAVNQFGEFHFGQLANQTMAPKPAKPWKAV